ncbi:MAG: hypothetical protein ACREN2_01770 [Candidatus Dormibacteria bacterium]
MAPRPTLGPATRIAVLIVLVGLTVALVSACGESPGQSVELATPMSGPPTAIANASNGNAPPTRVGAAVGFDPINRTVLMFGGAPATGSNLQTGHPATRLDETWQWDGQSWKQLHPKTSPPALFGARLVTDPSTQNLLLLAGAGDSAGSALQQEGAWEWDGNNWNRVGDTPVQVPFAAAATDPVHSQVLLSGFDPAYPSACAGCIPPPDYDRGGDFVMGQGGSGWNAASGDKPGWARAGTAFDPVSRRVITTAGSVQNEVQGTYAWDGDKWSLITTGTATNTNPDPNQPFGPCEAATDSHAQRIVMACEPAAGPSAGVTWTFDGQNWQKVSGSSTPTIAPNPVGQFSLAYDPAIPAVVMVIGGASGSMSIATWDGSHWNSVS